MFKSIVLRDRFIKLAGVFFLLQLFSNFPASAMTNLKEVQINGKAQVDLIFDSKINKNQVRTEFLNDVIQLSLSEASVYPAKISSVNGGKLTKVFAYQYAPKLVRCRFTVKGRAEDYRDRFQLSVNGKLLTVKISETLLNGVDQDQKPGPTTISQSKSPMTEGKGRASDAEPRSNSPVLEGAILEHGIKPQMKTGLAKASAEKTEMGGAGSDHPTLAGGRPLPSPWGVLAKLILVILLFFAASVLFKIFSRSRSRNEVAAKITQAARGGSGILGSIRDAIGGFARSAGEGLYRKAKTVEILSSHYLGPKKSIAIVRVAGRTLVLGVTNEAINLITELEGREGEGLGSSDWRCSEDSLPDLSRSRSEAAARSAAAEYVKSGFQAQARSESRLGPEISMRSPPFSDLLQKAHGRSPSLVTEAPQRPVRNQIRSRLEGLKQL